MDCKAPAIFLILNLSVCFLAAFAQPPDDASDPFERILRHVKATINACGGDTSLEEEVVTCLRTYVAATDREENTFSNSIQAGQELVDCLQPFRVALEGCSEAADRDNDLLVLDAFHTIVKDNGTVLGSMIDMAQNPGTGIPCEDEENSRVLRVLMECFEHASLHDDPLQVLLNFCASMDDALQCFTKVDDETDGCESTTKRNVDIYRTLLRDVHDKSEYRDLMGPCLGSLAHLV